MDRSQLSSEDVTSLIGTLLKSQDPATVGLRRIIKSKQESGSGFPVGSYDFQEFDSGRSQNRLFNASERRILELEQQVVKLTQDLATTRLNSQVAQKSAFDRGMLTGLGKGNEEGALRVGAEFEVKAKKMQDTLAAFMLSVESSQQAIYANGLQVLLRLTFELVQKIIHTEISTNREIVLSVLKKALSFIADRDKLVVRVARNDFETVTGNQDFWLPVAQRLTSIAIEPDDRIEQGGCIIESNSGVADARLGVQLDAMKDLVQKIWESLLDNPATATTDTTMYALPPQ